MSDSRFNLEQLALLNEVKSRSEGIIARHYRIPALPSARYPYEVATLADITDDERAAHALAHLVAYERRRQRAVEPLYRICLQDDAILGHPLTRGPNWLEGLLLYVLTHELVHVVRFQRSEQSFSAGLAHRQQEEELVHGLTLDLLGECKDVDLDPLRDLLPPDAITHRIA